MFENAIESLREGKAAQIRPRGQSMKGRVNSGALVTLEPRKDLSIDDVVLCRVKGNTYLHLIKAISADGKRFQIGNNRGGINGWTGRGNIYGKAIRIEK